MPQKRKSRLTGVALDPVRPGVSHKLASYGYLLGRLVVTEISPKEYGVQFENIPLPSMPQLLEILKKS